MKRSDSEVPKARLLKDVLVRVKAAYPDAALSEDIVRRLYPMWVKLWRKGFNAEHIAATTCSCDDGRTVMPSLAADLELGSVKLRIPKGAEPGVPFGFEARSFKTATEAGREASDSRFYGGIHYKFGVDNGFDNGNAIGKHILNTLTKFK